MNVNMNVAKTIKDNVMYAMVTAPTGAKTIDEFIGYYEFDINTGNCIAIDELEGIEYEVSVEAQAKVVNLLNKCMVN